MLNPKATLLLCSSPFYFDLLIYTNVARLNSLFNAKTISCICHLVLFTMLKIKIKALFMKLSIQAEKTPSCSWMFKHKSLPSFHVYTLYPLSWKTTMAWSHSRTWQHNSHCQYVWWWGEFPLIDTGPRLARDRSLQSYSTFHNKFLSMSSAGIMFIG